MKNLVLTLALLTGGAVLAQTSQPTPASQPATTPATQPAAQLSAAQSPDAVVARVGNQTLTLADFDRSFRVAVAGVVNAQGLPLSDDLLAEFASSRPEYLKQFVREQALTQLARASVKPDAAAIDAQLAQAGLTLQQYLDEAEEEEAATAEEFRATMESRSTDALKAQMLLDKVADDQQIGVEQEDLTQHIFRKAQQNESSPEQEMQHMMEHNHLPEWMTEIRRGKALEFIVSQATVTDADGNVVEVAPPVAEPALEEDQMEGDAEESDDSVSGEVLQGTASEEN